jgi:hypothetical protein
VSPIARQIVQDSIAVPFALALLLALVGRTLPARLRLHSVAAGTAVVAGFLAAFLAVYGALGLLPRDAASKLPTLALAGLLAGAALERADHRAIFRRLAPALVAAAVVGWLVWPRVASLLAVPAILVWAAGTFGLAATAAAETRPARQFAMLIGLALALAGVAFFARTVSIMQLALGLGASLAGLALATRLAGGGRLPPSALLPAGGILVGLAAILVLYSAAPQAALAPLAALPAAHWLSGPLARMGGRRERSVFALLCMVLPALAVLVARLALGPPGLP